MIKDKDGKEVVYFIGGSAGICPKDGNGNAMLDFHEPPEVGDKWIEGLECRDCGHKLVAGEYTEVKIGMDVDNREYTGIAADGTEVTLGCFDNPFDQMMRFLKDHPTPDTW
jgi:hypothetical protein